MKSVAIFFIRFYRRVLSPLKPYPTCRFYPTCSAYALEAFTKRSFFAALRLTLWRILRCSPLSPCGYDPVPETGFHTMPARWSKYDKTRVQAERELAAFWATADMSDGTGDFQESGTKDSPEDCRSQASPDSEACPQSNPPRDAAMTDRPVVREDGTEHR